MTDLAQPMKCFLKFLLSSALPLAPAAGAPGGMLDRQVGKAVTLRRVSLGDLTDQMKAWIDEGGGGEFKVAVGLPPEQVKKEVDVLKIGVAATPPRP